MADVPGDIIVLNDTRVDRHHGCTRVMNALCSLLAARNLRVAAYAPAHADWRRDASVLRALETARAIVVNGEGTLHHDRQAGAMLLEAGAWARQRGIPAVLVNAGWEANGGRFLERLRDFSLVAVRDSRSAAELRASGQACRVVPDLSLLGGSTFVAPTRAGIGVTDSVERKTSLALDRLRRRLHARPVSILTAGAGLRLQWHHVRTGIGRDDLARPRGAIGLLRARAAQLSAMVATPDEFIARLAGLELLVSGRFHACTLALLAGTPFVAVASNTAKIAALVADAGLDPSRATVVLEPDAIEGARARGWGAGEAAAGAAYVAHAHSAADALFDELRSLT